MIDCPVQPNPAFQVTTSSLYIVCMVWAAEEVPKRQLKRSLCQHAESLSPLKGIRADAAGSSSRQIWRCWGIRSSLAYNRRRELLCHYSSVVGRTVIFPL